MPRCKHCRKHFENRAVVNGHDEVLYGYCSRGCFQADNPQGYAEWLEKKRQAAERQTAMEKKIFELLRSAVRWYWGLRRKSMPVFWTVTVLLAVAIGTIVFFVRSGLGGRIAKAAAGRGSYGSVKNADLVAVAEECKDRMVEFKSVAERRYSDIGEAPSVEWVVEQTKDSPWMESCGTKCKKAGVYSIAIAKDEDGRDRIGVSCSVHGTDKDIHLGMDEGPEAARLCHHLQAERIVHSFEQPPVPDFRFDKLASGNYGCPTTGKLAIVANRTGELYDGIGEVVDVSGTKCSLHGDVFGCTEHEECVRLNEGLSEYRKKVAWKRKQEGRAPEPQPKPEPKTEPAPEPKAEPAPEPKAEPAPEPKAEPAPEPKAERKGPTARPESAKPTSTPAPAKKPTLTDLADRQATAYKEGTKTVEQIIEVIKSPKLTEPQRKRLRELLEERGVPLAEAERKAREEAKRKAVEAKRQAAEEAKRKAAEEAEARRKAAEEAEAKHKAAEAAEARRKEAEARKEAEFKERRQQAEAERLKRQEEDRKRREEAERLAKEEAEREQKRKDEEDRNRQKALDEITKSMQKLSEAAAKMDGRDDEEDDEEEEDEEDADTPFFRSGGVQTETLLEERRAMVEEQRRRAAAAEAQRRAEAAEAQRRAAAAEAQRRAAEQRKREEARKSQQMASQADPYAISPFSGDGTIEDDEPQQLVPSVRSATPPAMPDAMVEQLAAGIKMSVQGGQMTAAQAAFMLDNATLSAAQKAKVRKILAADGIKLPGGK